MILQRALERESYLTVAAILKFARKPITNQAGSQTACHN